MIWGLTLEPGQLYTETIENEIQLSMAALESRNSENTNENVDYTQVIVHSESAEYVLCTLVHGTIFQQYLDMKLMPGDKVKFCAEGKYVVHLTGYLLHAGEEYPLQVSHDNHEESGYQQLTEESGGWLAESLSDFKEETSEEIEEVEISLHIQDSGEEFSESSYKVEQQTRPQQLQSPQTVIQPQRRPQPRPQPRPQIPQTRKQSGASRRLLPGQRSLAVSPMQHASMRKRGALFHQRRPRKTVDPTHIRSGPLIRVKAENPQSVPCSPHLTQTQRPASHALYQQQVASDTVNVLPHTSLSSDESAHFTSIEQLPSISGTQSHELPGNSAGPDENITNTVISTTNMQRGYDSYVTVAAPMQEMDPGIRPGVSGADVPEVPGSNVPGTSRNEGSSMGQALSHNLSEMETAKLVHNSPKYPAEPIPIYKQSRENVVGAAHGSSIHKSFAASFSQSKPQMPVKCQFCQQIFTKKSACKIHENVHIGVKPYLCRFCNKGFARPGGRKDHENIHTGAKPYKCRLCGLAFGDHGARGRHEKYKHK